MWCITVCAIAFLPSVVWCHARLMEPPSRSSMWRVGFPTKKNFNDNALYCGGVQVQWSRNRGKCGICGDPWDMPHPRDNEAGGSYGTGIISRKYVTGQNILAIIDVTTNHRGYFEFRLCPHNDPSTEATQDCLDHHVLQSAAGDGTRYYVGPWQRGNITVALKLPEHLTCSHCVFQWTYVAGNNWGKCPDGTARLGCGPQETFRGCSDISVEKTRGFNSTHTYYPPHSSENDISNKHGHHEHRETHITKSNQPRFNSFSDIIKNSNSLNFLQDSYNRWKMFNNLNNLFSFAEKRIDFFPFQIRRGNLNVGRHRYLINQF